MSAKYLRITLDTAAGRTAIISGPYERLVNVKAHVRRVLAGTEPLTVWRPIATTHPLTNAPCTVRERSFFPSRNIASIEEVFWGAPTLVPQMDVPDSTFWRAVAVVARGSHGLFRVRTQRTADVIGLPVGTQLPIVKRDFYGDTEETVVWLDATGERTFRTRTLEVWANGERVSSVNPVALDEEDSAAMDGATVRGIGEDDDEEDID